MITLIILITDKIKGNVRPRDYFVSLLFDICIYTYLLSLLSPDTSHQNLCEKHFDLDVQSISIERARKVYHKGDRPSRVILTCGAE